MCATILIFLPFCVCVCVCVCVRVHLSFDTSWGCYKWPLFIYNYIYFSLFLSINFLTLCLHNNLYCTHTKRIAILLLEWKKMNVHKAMPGSYLLLTVYIIARGIYTFQFSNAEIARNQRCHWRSKLTSVLASPESCQWLDLCTQCVTRLD